MAKKIRPKSFEQACSLTKRDPKKILPYAKPANDFEEALNAVAMLWIIAEAIHNGWQADYDNSNQKKWYCFFKKTLSGFVFADAHCDWTFSGTGVGSRLSFENSDDAKYFGTKFIKLHNKVLLKFKQ